MASNTEVGNRFSLNGAIETNGLEVSSQDRFQVPDPLEGVVPGENRHERYQNFTDIIGEIWPKHEPGDYGRDFRRATRLGDFARHNDPSRADLTGFMAFSPFSIDPIGLSPEEFERMVGNLDTPDYVRVRSIPLSFATEDKPTILAGGSCVVNTSGMKTIAELRAEEEKLPKGALVDFAKRLIKRGPHISHFSDAVLSGQAVTVHYDESDMWRQRLEEWGISHDQAEDLVGNMYDQINQGVQRRARLINPNSTIVRVNFDELPGFQTEVATWITRMGLEDLPEFRLREVLHTYAGTNQLSLLHGAIKSRLSGDGIPQSERAKLNNILDAQVVLRTKQVDHIARIGSMRIDFVKIVDPDYSFATDPDSIDRDGEPDKSYRMVVGIMRHIYKEHGQEDVSALCAGFAALPSYHGAVMHEDREAGVDFTGQAGDQQYMEALEATFSNPAALYADNVESHLTFLANYIQDHSEERTSIQIAKQALRQELDPLRQQRKELSSRAKRLQSDIDRVSLTVEQELGIVDFLVYLSGPPVQVSEDKSIEYRIIASQLRDSLKKRMDPKAKTPENQRDDSQNKNPEVFPRLLQMVEAVMVGNIPVLNNADQLAIIEYTAMTEKSIAMAAEQKQGKEEMLERNREALILLSDEVSEKEQKSRELDRQNAQLSRYNLFPLRDNPFIHHAMQFLWDSDFAYYITQAVYLARERAQIPNDGQEAAQRRRTVDGKMRELTAVIYPKLAGYINYLFGRIDYAADLKAPAFQTFPGLAEVA